MFLCDTNCYGTYTVKWFTILIFFIYKKFFPINYCNISSVYSLITHICFKSTCFYLIFYTIKNTWNNLIKLTINHSIYGSFSISIFIIVVGCFRNDSISIDKFAYTLVCWLKNNSSCNIYISKPLI